MNKILVDTDILIDYSKGFGQKLEDLFSDQLKGRVELNVCPVNLAEFLNNEQLKDGRKLDQAHEFLGLFGVTDITKSVGIRAGEIMRIKQSDYLGDALVAAVCLEKKMAFLTRNKKHFRLVEGMKFVDG